MWKPNSKFSSSSLKQVLNMFRVAEAFQKTSECATLQGKCDQPKPKLLCKSISFLATIYNNIITTQELPDRWQSC